ncbi:hypothetical protein BBP40_004864 [Aspergillus hancockii]|nr:hypothetical protein BBP40_004864 [Aspergillus hancockii]
MPEGGTSKNKKKNKGSAKIQEENGETVEKAQDPSTERQMEGTPGALDSSSKERFDVLVRDRDSLRAEVTDMRKSLEKIQFKHRADMEALQHKLNDAESKKEHAELQFQKLLERVNTIKSQLGERLREDAEELAQATSKIGELQEQNLVMKEDVQAKRSKLERLEEENKQKSKELTNLRDRLKLSQQNWLKEKEELLAQESYLQSEFEQAKEAMHNWEVLAMEERSIRENLSGKAVDLEEQLASLKDAYERASAERDSQLTAADGLKRALQEIQTARKKELRELVESSDAQLEELKQAFHGAEKKALDADKAFQDARDELDRVRPHIVTNHLLHFLALDRSDPKKFQILQLIAALLGWTDEQREQAGLARPGTSTTSGKLRVPSTHVYHTPSTPTLATEFLDNGNSSKESLAELWSNFLEQESQAALENAHLKP